MSEQVIAPFCIEQQVQTGLRGTATAAVELPRVVPVKISPLFQELREFREQD